jgi:hypothetical protein
VTATIRNVLIVLALAAAVYFLPGGGDVALLVQAVLWIGIMAAFVLIAARFYRENRVAIFSLGDRWRGLLYGAIATAIFAMAALPRLLDTGGGILLWFVLVGGSSYALYRVWRQHREYGF